MAIRERNVLKEWFRTGKYPTQEQFWDWLDSFFHLKDKLTLSQIEGLQDVLNDQWQNMQLWVMGLLEDYYNKGEIDELLEDLRVWMDEHLTEVLENYHTQEEITELLDNLKVWADEHVQELLENYHTKAEIKDLLDDLKKKLDAKQNKLVAGKNITLTDNADGTTTIESSGSGGTGGEYVSDDDIDKPFLFRSAVPTVASKDAIPAASEMTEAVTGDVQGIYRVQCLNGGIDSGLLLNFREKAGGTRCVQLFTQESTGLWWRNGKGNVLTGRIWRQMLDTVNHEALLKSKYMANSSRTDVSIVKGIGSIPAKEDLTESVIGTLNSGVFHVNGNGESGMLLHFADAVSISSTKYTQFYSKWNSSLMWRNDTNGLLGNKEWRTLLDSLNYKTYVTPVNIGAATTKDNVASATKLQTARKITVGKTSKTFDGTADVAWTHNEMGVSNILWDGVIVLDNAGTLTATKKGGSKDFTITKVNNNIQILMTGTPSTDYNIIANMYSANTGITDLLDYRISTAVTGNVAFIRVYKGENVATNNFGVRLTITGV